MKTNIGNTLVRSEAHVPLCVDLDGSLVVNDTFYTSLLALLKQNFAYLALLPIWLLRGKAYVKQEVSKRLEPRLDRVIFHSAVVAFLRNEYANGRELLLVTGADQRVAHFVADHLQIFSEVLASDGSLNVTGPRKAKLLVERFGEGGFDYLGNSKVDLEIWKHSKSALIVSDDQELQAAVREVVPIASQFNQENAAKPATLMDYVHIARPDHWFKNIFILPGALLAFFFFSVPLEASLFASLALGIFACCLVASSNYVINEFLDAERDRHHPVKKARPLAAGRISEPIALAEWLLLGAVGIALGFATNRYVGGSCLFLWIMGVIYNVPPIRSKELPFFDVLSESINNPIRMALGWYAMGVTVMPPISALFAYWMFGAFLMATKRLAEYRRIGNKELAASYRKSFAYYDEERLVVGTIFYVSLFMTGSVVFMMLYRLELILAVPLIAYLLAYYLYLGFKPDSPVQYPEKLYQDSNLVLAVTLCSLLCVALFLVDIPSFRDLFVLLPR